MTEHSRYPRDLSDARQQLIESVLAAWRAERRARTLDIVTSSGVVYELISK